MKEEKNKKTPQEPEEKIKEQQPPQQEVAPAAEPTIENQEMISIGNLLSKTIEGFQQKWLAFLKWYAIYFGAWIGFVILLSVIGLILFVAFGFSTSMFEGGFSFSQLVDQDLAMVILLSILVIAFFGGFIFLAIAIASVFQMGNVVIANSQSNDPSIGELFSKAKEKIWPYIGLTILGGIAIFIGFIFFIIPGVILMIYLSLALYILVLEDTTMMEAVNKSFKLAEGYWWAVFGRLMLGILIVMGLMIPTMIVMMIVSLIPGVGFLVNQAVGYVLGTLGILFWYNIYADLKRLKANE